MAISLKHKFQSTVPDQPKPGLVRPSNWNDEHDLVVSGPSIIGRKESGQGPAQELSVPEVAGMLDGQFATADQGTKADSAVQPADLDGVIPPISADTMLVDSPDGTLRETKTFPQVRAALFVPSFDDLSYVDASQHGCPGNGTDQTAAMQAIIDGLPPEGGNILIKGDVRWTQLTAADRRNIRFIGLGGQGAGASQRTLFRCIAGALGSGVSAFNLKRTMNVSFEKMYIDSRDPTFTGTLLDWGDLTSGSALMSMTDCYLNVLSNVSGARGINLYGATQGKFERVKFSGARILIQMQNAVGVGFCNQHLFLSCSFNPTGSQYPVSGSGEGITFQNCNIQASSGDGIGRFWSTDLTQPFRGVSLIGNTFYDVLTTSGVWANFYTGESLVIQGNQLGGAADVTAGSNYGIFIGGGTAGVLGAEKGVVGVDLRCNQGRYMTALFSFGGSKANYNNVRYLKAGGNRAFGSLTPSGATALYSSVGQLDHAIFEPSEQNGNPFAFGTNLNLAYIPHYADRTAALAAGHQVGDVFVSTVSPYPLLTV